MNDALVVDLIQNGGEIVTAETKSNLDSVV